MTRKETLKNEIVMIGSGKSAPFYLLTENLNNKNSVKWNNDVKPKEFTASRINQLTWDDASGRLKVTLDGNTVAYIPVVYN